MCCRSASRGVISFPLLAPQPSLLPSLPAYQAHVCSPAPSLSRSLPPRQPHVAVLLVRRRSALLTLTEGSLVAEGRGFSLFLPPRSASPSLSPASSHACFAALSTSVSHLKVVCRLAHECRASHPHSSVHPVRRSLPLLLSLNNAQSVCKISKYVVANPTPHHTHTHARTMAKQGQHVELSLQTRINYFVQVLIFYSHIVC